jgi:hypothetical protein
LILREGFLIFEGDLVTSAIPDHRELREDRTDALLGSDR